MPILFNCTLVCDAEGCESQQEAVAELDASVLGVAGILGLLGGASPVPFKYRYDVKSGLTWRVAAGRAVCSQACDERLSATLQAEREKQTKVDAAVEKAPED